MVQCSRTKKKRDLSSLNAAGYYCYLKSRPNLQNEENREANKTIFTQKGGHLKMLAYVPRVKDEDQKTGEVCLILDRDFKSQNR